MALPPTLNDRHRLSYREPAASPGTVTVAVTNPDGTNIGGSGGTSMVDNSAFTEGGSSLTPAGFEGQDTPGAVTNGNIAAARLNRTTRAQYFEPLDSGGATTTDTVNHAVKVNVVAGAAGGGVAQTQVRNNANPSTSWVNVGPGAGDVVMPINLYDGAGNVVKILNAAPAGTEYALVTRNIPSGTQPVSGTFWQATQPISAVDGQPVNIGTTTQTKATDGSITSWSVIQLLKGIFDKLLGSIAVTGTFWQPTQPVSIAAAIDVSDRAARLLGVSKIVDAAGTNQLAVTAANAAKVDGSAVTQPISGTVTANQGAPPWDMEGDTAAAATDAGKPLKVGGKATTTQPAAVATGQRVNAAFDEHGSQYVRAGHQAPAPSIWTAHSVPAANTQATVSRAAAGIGIRNVCTELTVALAAGATAPTAVQLSVSLIDGASAGLTYLWRAVIALPATAGAVTGFVVSGLWLPGTANTAMTLEFSAAGGVNTFESVSMSGLTVAE